MADHDGHTINVGPVTVGRHVGWRCADCCYSWPLSRPPLTSDECDNCGGEFEGVYEFGTAPLHPTTDAESTAQSVTEPDTVAMGVLQRLTALVRPSESVAAIPAEEATEQSDEPDARSQGGRA